MEVLDGHGGELQGYDWINLDTLDEFSLSFFPSSPPPTMSNNQNPQLILPPTSNLNALLNGTSNLSNSSHNNTGSPDFSSLLLFSSGLNNKLSPQPSSPRYNPVFSKMLQGKTFPKLSLKADAFHQTIVNSEINLKETQ
jgi:hypothetical protein